jgi:hypothetical protein
MLGLTLFAVLLYVALEIEVCLDRGRSRQVL